MRHILTFLFFGLLFGFVLSRAGVTDYDAIAGMFLLTDLHVAGVIAVAIAVAGPALWWLRRRSGGAIAITPKPRKAGNLVGGLVFGAGWALTGTCPGTGLAQIGEGKLMALFTVGGILIGTALYRAFGARVEAALTSASSRRREPTATVHTAAE